MTVFEEINGWSAEKLLGMISLPAARKTGYVCPDCSNGTGDTGDGIKSRTNEHGQIRWKCFKCGRDFSNFDLAAAVYGYNTEHGETAQAAKRLASEFGLTDDSNFSFSRKQSARHTFGAGDKKGDMMMDEKKSVHDKEPKDYAKFYAYCRGNVDKFLAERGGTWRGLTAATFTKYGLGFNPKFGVEGHEKRPHVIIPYDDTHFVARAIEGGDRSQHGKEAGLYEPEPIDEKLAAFIVEGELDALSVVQAVGVRCIAIGGASKCNKVVPELNRRFANVERKPWFVVMFDNDDAGRKHSPKLVTALRAAGYPADSFFLEEGTDANDLLQRCGAEELSYQITNAIASLDASLRNQAQQMMMSAEHDRLAAENKSGIRDFPIADYFAVQFEQDVALSAKYSNRLTGFANLDGTGKFSRDGQKQIFAPGLYILGAQPGAGKTTFAWQLVNQLAQRGEFCVFCSYEMSRLEMYSKTISRELFNRKRAGQPVMALSAADIRRGAGSGIAEVRQIASELSKSTANLRVLELTNTTVTELFAYLKPLIEKAGKVPVVVIDYLQIIPPNLNKAATAKEKIDDLMLRFKNFQRDTNATLIIISALNRASNLQSEPGLSAFRESSAIEFSADVTWALQIKGESDAMKKNPRAMTLYCKKNRNGAIYDAFFNYYPRNDCFVPCTEQDCGDDDEALPDDDPFHGEPIDINSVANPFD